jgi:hypothetical protein
MMASVSTRSKQEENSGWHCINRLFMNYDGLSVNQEQARGKLWWALQYDQYRPAPFDMLLVTIHFLLDSVFMLYISNDK